MPKKKLQQVAKQTSTPSDGQNVIWPSITVKEDLLCRELIPDQIYIIDVHLLRYSNVYRLKNSDPTPPPKRGEATRVNHRISFQSKDFALVLYNAISPHLPPLPSSETRATDVAPVGCNSNIRLYKYDPGQYFGAHYDDSVRDAATGWWSEWTILVYVTGHEDGVEGGETVFHQDVPGSKKKTEEIVPPLARGSVLIHRHGRACMLHEGREVKKGTKLVLRSDIMFARP
ncbi:2OG-Fe(II) oxygenase family protein [Ceratobasidium sp. AG-Ba]|nr:2OG-Fe(II) oxygenase family protein [Ceratobasidium sp. AG-Ba]